MYARFLLVAALVLLAGCKSIETPKVPGVTPYRMVIQQGNFVSDEMIAQLKPGMTREQVRFVLGTPLVTDIFHADRWDYVFYRELPNGRKEQRNLTVVFEDGKLARVIGDLLPDPNAPKPAAAKPAAEPKVPTAATKPAAEPAKPAPQPADRSWEPTPQNWSSGGDNAAAKPEPEPKQEAARPEEPKKEERGFFGRLLDRITPAPAAEAKPASEPAAETKPQAEAPKPEPKPEEKAAEEQKPEEPKKERGFFGRMLEKIGL
ncbi:MAG: outer membrane protein assembly factor BamE [Pseudomonadota bacterium]